MSAYGHLLPHPFTFFSSPVQLLMLCLRPCSACAEGHVCLETRPSLLLALMESWKTLPLVMV